MVVSPLSDPASIFLDLIRLILAQIVVLGHAASFNGLLDATHFPWLQSIAVVGFFILSGFVITYSSLLKLEKNSEYSFKEFFIERFSRIYAGLVPALLFVFVLDLLFINYFSQQYQFYYSFDWITALKNLFMLEKYPVEVLATPMFGSASTWWSLAIEWWFYMCFGWILLYRRISVKTSIYYLFLVFFLIVPLNYMVQGQSSIAIGITYVWLAGALAVFLREKAAVAIKKRELLALGMLFFVIAGIRYQESMDAYDLLAALNLTLSFIFIVMYFDKKDTSELVKYKKVIHFIAGYSLTLYLVHYSILLFIQAMGIESSLMSFGFGVIFSNLIALLIAIPTEMKYHKLSKFLKIKFVGSKVL